MKRNAPKFRRKKKTQPLFILLLLVVLLPVIGGALFLGTFDLNSYRDQLGQAVSQKTGHEVRFADKIAWQFSWSQGLGLQAKDVTIMNPEGASRPDMAHIDKARLQLNLWPLLRRKIDIISFTLSGANIQLETCKNGEGNWLLPSSPTTADKSAATPKTQTASVAKPPVTLHIRKVVIRDSRVGYKNKDGSLNLFDVPELALTNGTDGIRVHFKGIIDGQQAEFDLAGKELDKITEANWPFNIVISFDEIKAEAHGALHDGLKKIDLDKLLVESSDDRISGNMALDLDRPRPYLTGDFTSQILDLDRLIAAMGNNADQPTTTETPAAPAEHTLFSRSPLAFDKLKIIDANLSLAIGKLEFSHSMIENFSAKIALANGRLAIDPVLGEMTGNKTESALHIDVDQEGTAKVAFILKAPSLNLSQLFQLGGVESAISGKTDVDINITTMGASSRELAAHANGKVLLVMDSGTVSSSKLAHIAGSLLQLFAPGVSALTSPGINCLAARYQITDGLMDTKGLLIDTEMTTISGKGYINLPDERIGMSLFTRPKGLGIGGIIPPMHISGSLLSPQFALDASGAAEKIKGLLLSESTTATGVPNIVQINGVNACVYALDHPNAVAPMDTTPLVPSAGMIDALTDGGLDELSEKVKDIGSSLLKGFIGE